jgi:hypothetical protein
MNRCQLMLVAEPAKLLAIFVVDGDDNPLTVPDK